MFKLVASRGLWLRGTWFAFWVVCSFLCVVGVGQAEFGFKAFSAGVFNSDGSVDVQAGSHPFELRTALMFNRTENIVDGEAKDVVVELPPGLVGNPNVTEHCSVADFETQKVHPLGGSSYELSGDSCPAGSQVGIVAAELSVLRGGPPFAFSFGIFNVVAPPDVPAEIGFKALGLPVLLTPSLRTGRDYGLTVTSKNTSQISPLFGVQTAFWGVPADPAHDGVRGECLGFEGESLGSCPVEAGLKPFLTLPSECSGEPLVFKIHADSWREPGVVNLDGTPDLSDPRWRTPPAVMSPALTGCSRLSFRPGFSLTPDTTQADAPSGDSAVDVSIPQEEVAGGLATADLREATVSAPEGVSLNPGAADGLVGCSDAQIALSSALAGTCPSGSVVGSVRITTPLLEEPLVGQVFVGNPECSPCTAPDAQSGRMLRLFMQAQGSGIIVKLAGIATADPVTGQLVVHFKELPQAPVSDVLLTFNGGARSVFINPLRCGPASLSTVFTPWSAPAAASASPISVFDVDWDGHGAPCPAVLPFTPVFNAGSVSSAAGTFTPFGVTLTRPDRDQQLSALSVQTPAGVSGILAGIPLCEEPQAAQGTCSQSSRIGTSSVDSGTGAHPFRLSAPVYLTGPYKGAPFGLSVAVAAVAGPFNLGRVVVRAAIRVDPHTAALTIISDPFPQVVSGVRTHIQTVNVVVDRPGFTFNPTNCNAHAINGMVASVEGGSTDVSSPFAVAGCRSLSFSPVLSASTRGKARHNFNGASLNVKVAAQEGPRETGGEANIAKVDVQLPKLLPARLTTLQKACTAAQFETNPAGCPRASNVGSAVALTPILSVPLHGPAYLVSHGGAAFPDLDIVLQGEGVTLVLSGNTNIKGQITYSRFETVPDAPITSFEVNLPEGPNSALASPSGNLCGKSLVMPTAITAQNGAVLKQNTKIKLTGCPKPKPKPAPKSKRKRTKKGTHSSSSLRLVGTAAMRGN